MDLQKIKRNQGFNPKFLDLLGWVGGFILVRPTRLCGLTSCVFKLSQQPVITSTIN
jgi:hypothetical protein